MLFPGDTAPFFTAPSTVNPQFCFDTAAGRYIVLSFFGSSQIPSSEQFLTEIVKRGDRFDVANTIFFGVTNDPQDAQRISHQHNGRIYFFDLDLSISRLYGLVAAPSPGQVVAGSDAVALSRRTFVLDQALRIVAIIDMRDDDVARQIDAIFKTLDAMPKLDALKTQAPVLIVPYVFEPAFCKRLIDYYNTHEVEDSGFMRDQDGKTVGVIDYAHKRRMDCSITDDELIRAAQERIKRRIVPAIQHAYQFSATRIERHIVSCYDAAQGAHFRAHRDNTTLGTAHRRFAVTINLNSPEYEGGEIWFPEFGPKKYKAPSGAAIVFSCSLLHEVPRVTKGVRFAFLPFLYDDAAAALRQRNRQYLGDLSAAGRAVTHVCDGPGPAAATTSTDSATPTPTYDGSAGCGHPEGCQTCLTSPTYEIGIPTPAKKSEA